MDEATRVWNEMYDKYLSEVGLEQYSVLLAQVEDAVKEAYNKGRSESEKTK